jgi:hypothetical protein
MTDARMVATNTHRRWLAVQSAAPRADRMTCSSHGLALGLIKTRCLPIQSLTSPSCSKEAFSLPWSHAAKQASDGRLASASRSIPSAAGPWARCLSLLFHCWMLAIPARAHSSSCSWDDAPPTPRPPSIWPFRKMVDDGFNLATRETSARRHDRLSDGKPVGLSVNSIHAIECDQVA